MEAIQVMNKSSLAILNEALLKTGLREAGEIIGKKYCFASSATTDKKYPRRVIVGTIAEVYLEDGEMLTVVPNSPSDPMYQLVSFRWINWEEGEPVWAAEFFGPLQSDDDEKPGYGTQEGIFYLIG